LWSVYLGEEQTGSDTSGSAAIAAGLALGAKLGLIAKAETERTAREAARHALAGFVPHLAADGMLGGVAQLNRGGEPLQRGGFRVLAPFAMGLLASARAVVDSGKSMV
jgi:rhamnogalacturonyl hydrolase YesR